MSDSQTAADIDTVIAIIDDEESVRNALVDQLESMDRKAMAYASASEFLDSSEVSAPGCILLDLQMPQMNGLDLQESLAQAGNRKPIVFMTGNASVNTSVHALKAGAVDYLIKPFDCKSMIEAIDRALERDRQDRLEAAVREQAMAFARKLTPREVEVMEFVSKGLMNKQIAFEMGISEIMVKLHRGRMMRKMKARSIPDIVRKFDQIKSAGLLSCLRTRNSTAAMQEA